jgi:hypothetical protein
MEQKTKMEYISKFFGAFPKIKGKNFFTKTAARGANI